MDPFTSSHAHCLHLDLPVLGIVHFDDNLVWPLTRVVALVLFLACCMAYRHAGMTMRQLAAGTFCCAVLSAGLAAAGAVVPRAPGTSGSLYVAACVLLFVESQRLLCQRLGVPATVLGTMLVLLLALIILSATMPGASYLLAWPLLAALVAYGASLLQHERSRQTTILLAGALPAAALFVPLLRHAATVQGSGHQTAIMLVIAAMLGCCAAPLIHLRMAVPPTPR